jgi:NADP-dependent 3-hydroxy acid dehydrogenase YdfG
VKAIYGQVLEKFGTVDILMNNAGKMGLTRIEDVTVEELYKYEKVNIEGMFLMSRSSSSSAISRKRADISSTPSPNRLSPPTAAGIHLILPPRVRSFRSRAVWQKKWGLAGFS